MKRTCIFKVAALCLDGADVADLGKILNIFFKDDFKNKKIQITFFKALCNHQHCTG